MKLRYAEGTGIPPIHVASIRRELGGRGAFVLSGQGRDDHQIPFSSKAEFLQLLRALMVESVALSVGGHCPGPADEAALLMAGGELEGSYVEISWSAPEHWTVREMSSKGSTPPWEKVFEPSLIANTSFQGTLRLSAARP